MIDERGLGAFSLREVARRAGVSHNAPAHHFGDVRGLLTSLAQEGFEVLRSAMEAAVAGHDDPVERLIAIGQAYVELGKSHHAHCEVMFRTDVVDQEDPDLQAAGRAAYALLEGTVRAVIDGEGLDTDLDTAAWLCWSVVQGLVMLEPKMGQLNEARGKAPVSTGELVRRLTILTVDGLRGAAPGG